MNGFIYSIDPFDFGIKYKDNYDKASGKIDEEDKVLKRKLVQTKMIDWLITVKGDYPIYISLISYPIGESLQAIQYSLVFLT